MANKKNKLGKIVASSLGYHVRIMLESKNKEKTVNGKLIRTSFLGDNGKFSVYAGKNLQKDNFTSKTEALDYCTELYNKK